MDDITKRILAALTPEEIKQFITEHNIDLGDEDTPKPKRKQSRKKTRQSRKKKVVKKTAGKVRGKKKLLKKNTKKKSNRDDFDVHEHRKKMSASRDSGIPCQRSSIELSGENIWLEDDDYDSERQAMSIDDILLQGVKRRKKKSRQEDVYVEAKCWECEDWYEIPENDVTEVDEETDENLFRCDECFSRSIGRNKSKREED